MCFLGLVCWSCTAMGCTHKSSRTPLSLSRPQALVVVDKDAEGHVSSRREMGVM